ncbi:hypothetical protein [Blastococcus sp. TF02A-35]|uniref:hypothetical protein n=1 Tax=Blastococcus sp. TF02A-35 TaxID=2559612 RepID=UPI00142F70FD|nr:hypothetical protein [Blastococcus sp. TF02A_35]
MTTSIDARDPDRQPLAGALLDTCPPGALPTRAATAVGLSCTHTDVRALVDCWLTRSRLRPALVVALRVLGLSALADLVTIGATTLESRNASTGAVVTWTDGSAWVGIEDRRGVLLLLERAVLDADVGATLLVGSVLLFRKRTRRATELTQTAQAPVSLLVFYVNQFAAAFSAPAQLAAQRYQRLTARRPDRLPESCDSGNQTAAGAIR